MRTYTYKFHFTNTDETVKFERDSKLDWEKLPLYKFARFNTPNGSVIINMRNVTIVEEIINK